jgi:chemotaxis protein methyltransferase CheR
VDDVAARLTGLLQRAVGLVPEAARLGSLDAAVADGMARTGSRDAEGYLARVCADAAELQRLAEAVLIHETHFARAPVQISALTDVLLPELLAAAAPQRRLRVWSAGCSTGEEPWTVAILLHRLLGPAALPSAPGGWSLEVLGTDLSETALEVARRGVYGARSVGLLDPADLARFLMRAPGATGGERWRVSDRLRPGVRFVRHNLVTDPLPVVPGSVDLVVCRNVTIYFDRPTTRRVVDGFLTALRPGGLLLLGPAETLWRLHDGFEPVRVGDAFAWRKPGVAAARVAAPAGPAPTGPAPEREHDGPVRPAIAAGRGPVRPAAVRDGRPHLWRGVELARTGDDVGAITELRKALFLSPGLALASVLQAQACGRLGDAAGAARAYAAAAAALRSESDEAAAGIGGTRRFRLELAAACTWLAGGSGAATPDVAAACGWLERLPV